MRRRFPFLSTIAVAAVSSALMPLSAAPGDSFFSEPLKVSYTQKNRQFHAYPDRVDAAGQAYIYTGEFVGSEPVKKAVTMIKETGEFYDEATEKVELFYKNRDELLVLTGGDNLSPEGKITAWGVLNGTTYEVVIPENGEAITTEKTGAVDEAEHFYPHQYFVHSIEIMPPRLTVPDDNKTTFTIQRTNGHTTFCKSKVNALVEWKYTTRGRGNGFFTGDWTEFHGQKMPGRVHRVTYSYESKKENEIIYDDIKYESITADEYEDVRAEYFLPYVSSQQ